MGPCLLLQKNEASTSKRKILLYREGHSLKASEGLEDKKKGPKKVGRNMMCGPGGSMVGV